MLSYQHGYHAGNMADVHKHALLAWSLAYMTRKDKPLSYLETHAGRGLYDTTDEAAVKTGEAAKGITIAEGWFARDHPYAQVLDRIRAKHGATAYPGSPLVAAESLRPMDDIHLSELHPQEFAALKSAMGPYGGIYRQRDGWEMALSLCPPDPRRGLLLIDPSFEVKSDYDTIPDTIAKIHRKWGVGVIMLWYPILTDGPHIPMIKALKSAIPDGLVSEVAFPPARPGHRMVGSGLFVVNAPYGFAEESGRLKALFHKNLKSV
ncbi:23S rRNA (adenine(2030)-N(6))-methyltransferase RlmJ [Loktanella sp. D2R18]|uniref:23S rRNA (adenine(2030)-N(6))-methyltransferase RlmJ n=1 Tax=Rhodobacterales TaxID=204455 RepID=UPI000DE80098|nr:MULTISPECIES: 23S rRNA (adenine(2030)-N(6))-methyltransferase RlmJ [Rhodobacterales]MDO6591694.1 23S rRNA (adenine(2030)-N(6))-methyltransferase RlmJ [Yoonia sp. 1_MG-2023]RBW42520.1 23S rRNA (adenine(2030)-N(6))-methyltransferase RlmJ [Loktanella sp. D2R18]